MDRRSFLLPSLVLAFAGIGVSHAEAQTVLLHDDFENGLALWTAAGLWNLESSTDPCGALHAPFPDGTRAAYFGRENLCDYDTGPLGSRGELTLVSPLVVPSSSPRAEVRWRQFLRSENDCNDGYDWSSVEVEDAGAGNWQRVALNCAGDLQVPSEIGWHERAANLDAYVGRTIRLRFVFDSFDGIDNQRFGWLVDDVRVLGQAGEFFCPGLCPCAGPAHEAVIFTPVGCRNSSGAGPRIDGGGIASVSSDSLALTARGLPPGTLALLVESLTSSVNGTTFGDGTLCLTGTLRRIVARPSAGSVLTFPGPFDRPLSHSLQAPVPGAGLVVRYQVIYRDTATFCTPSQWSVSSGLAVPWSP